ncbi:MAG: B12-binding domain-containing radical SAM protein [Candidatus Altiarchaeota archaeon]|nr:B12-binding domain-containing radical SAM protein [Candidatus Altiarchaeota archaeon]
MVYLLNKTKYINLDTMDILFIDPSEEPSVGLMSIQAYLKKNGYSSKIIYEKSPGFIIQEIIDNKPLYVGFSCNTINYPHCLTLSKKIKSSTGIQIIFGGVHPSIDPSIIDEASIDVVCIGEGELTMVELLERVKKGSSIIDIKGLWIKEDGKIHRNGQRELLENLDILPFWDRSDYYKKFPYKAREYSKNFSIGRGCNYNCSFCIHHLFREKFCNDSNYFRQHSVDYVIEHILYVKEKWGLNAITFRDDTFGSNKEWLNEFAQKYKKYVKLPYVAGFSVKEVDVNTLRKLRQSGLVMLGVGLETSHERIRAGILNKHFTNNDYLRAVDTIRKNDILVWTFVLHGIITQKKEEIIEDILFLNKVKPFVLNNFFVIYFPFFHITRLGIDKKELVVASTKHQLYPGQLIKPLSNDFIGLCLAFHLCSRWPVLIPLVEKISAIIPLESLDYVFISYLVTKYLFLAKITYFWFKIDFIGYGRSLVLKSISRVFRV